MLTSKSDVTELTMEYEMSALMPMSRLVAYTLPTLVPTGVASLTDSEYIVRSNTGGLSLTSTSEMVTVATDVRDGVP